MHPDPGRSNVGDEVRSPNGSQSPHVNAQHPWLGLLPYKEEHREFFFGRDREVEDILGRIRDNNLTILYGQSGLGKSSLLAAGVVPRLREAGYRPSITRLNYSRMVEQHLPLGIQTGHSIIEAERNLLSETASRMRDFGDTLWEHFHRRDRRGQNIVVLIFDQFEEIFTLGAQPQFEHQVADWLEQMADLLQNRPPRQLAERFAQDRALAEQYHFGDAPVRIVFTLREDYLANLERWKAQLPLLMQNRMALTLLTGPQARQAVLGPAQLGDNSLVSREVAESIVCTVARVPFDTPLDQIKAVPPLLSLLCEQLNAARLSANAPQITTESVRDQAADILQRFYEDSFLSFPEEHRARIRAMLEDPPMITEGGYRNALVRDDAEAQLTRAGVPDAKTVFNTLIQRRLITIETRDMVQRLEITHDVLVPLLLRSRKERQDIKDKQDARLAALASLAERERLTKERHRLRVIVAVMASLAILAISLAAYAVRSDAAARMATKVAVEQQEKATLLNQIASRKALGAAREAFASDRAAIQSDPGRGFAHLAESIALDPFNSAAVKEVVQRVAWGPFPAPIPTVAKYSIVGEIESIKVTSSDKLILLSKRGKETNISSIALAKGASQGEQVTIHTSRWDPIITPDGKWLISGPSFERVVMQDLRETDNGPPPMTEIVLPTRVTSVDASSDAKRIVVGFGEHLAGKPSEIRIFDLRNGSEIIRSRAINGDVYAAIANADGSRVYYASGNQVFEWEISSNTYRAIASLDDSGLDYLLINLRNDALLVREQSGKGRILDLTSHRSVKELPSILVDNIEEFNSNGLEMGISQSNTLTVSNALSDSTGRQFTIQTDSVIVDWDFSQDDIAVAALDDTGAIGLWNRLTGERVLRANHAKAVCMAFLRDGRHLVTVSAGEIRIWPFSKPLAANDLKELESGPHDSIFSSKSVNLLKRRMAEVESSHFHSSERTVNDVKNFGGALIGDDGQLVHLTDSGPFQWRDALVSSDPGTDRLMRMFCWHITAHNERTILPEVDSSTASFITDELLDAAAGGVVKDRIQRLYWIDPGHPLVPFALSVGQSDETLKAYYKSIGWSRIAGDESLRKIAETICSSVIKTGSGTEIQTPGVQWNTRRFNAIAYVPLEDLKNFYRFTDLVENDNGAFLKSPIYILRIDRDLGRVGINSIPFQLLRPAVRREGKIYISIDDISWIDSLLRPQQMPTGFGLQAVQILNLTPEDDRAIRLSKLLTEGLNKVGLATVNDANAPNSARVSIAVEKTLAELMTMQCDIPRPLAESPPGVFLHSVAMATAVHASSTHPFKASKDFKDCGVSWSVPLSNRTTFPEFVLKIGIVEGEPLTEEGLSSVADSWVDGFTRYLSAMKNRVNKPKEEK